MKMTCQGPHCGRAIVWALTPSGARIPLEHVRRTPTPPPPSPHGRPRLYELEHHADDPLPRAVAVPWDHNSGNPIYIYHHLTCVDREALLAL